MVSKGQGIDRGQRQTAGWAQRRRFCTLYGANTPVLVPGTDVATAPARGGGLALPGGVSALIPGEAWNAGKKHKPCIIPPISLPYP